MNALTTDKLKRLIYNMSVSYINSFLGFIIYLMLAKLLGADDYSVIAVGIAVGGFVAPLLDFGSSKTFVRDAVQIDDSDKFKDLVLLNLNVRYTVSLFALLLVFLFSYLYTQEIEEALVVSMLSLWAGMLGLYPTSWFDYKNKTMVQNVCVVYERALVLLLIGCVFLFDLGSYALILTSILLFLLRFGSVVYQVNLWWRMFSNKDFLLKLKLPTSDTKGINILFTLSMLSNALLTYGNQLIYGKYGNDVELSAYSLAFQLVSLIFLFQSQAIRVLNRDISEINKTGVAKDIVKHAFIHSIFLMAVSGCIAFALFVASKYLPLILDDVRYESISKFMPILCVWITVVGMGQIVTQYLLEVREERFYFLTSMSAGIIAFFLGLFYVPIYGAISIAVILLLVHVSVIISNTVRLIYMHYFKVRVMN